jgi:hypothetical protein
MTAGPDRCAQEPGAEAPGSAGPAGAAAPTISPRSTEGTEQDRAQEELVTGLIAAARSDASLSPADQDKLVQEIASLRDRAFGSPPDAGAMAELEAMARADEIIGLDNLAKALTGIVVLTTGLFTGLGFSSGDMLRMIRDSPAVGLVFLSSAGVAVFLGTFAFGINAYRSLANFWMERIAVYSGVALGALSLVMACVGLSQGAGAGSASPVLIGSLDTTGSVPSLQLVVQTSDVPRSDHARATVWGRTDQGSWVVLAHLVTGPARDGSVDQHLSIPAVTGYVVLVAEANVSSSVGGPAAGQPPAACQISGDSGRAAPAPSPASSCLVLQGVPAAGGTGTS